MLSIKHIATNASQAHGDSNGCFQNTVEETQATQEIDESIPYQMPGSLTMHFTFKDNAALRPRQTSYIS